MNTLEQWAKRHGIPDTALSDLKRRIGVENPDSPPGLWSGRSEAALINEVRYEASKKGMRLFRNNVGVATTNSGRVVRFGLANDSANMNAALKSSDLIGINPVIISTEDVGRTMGQFTAIEVKRPGWKYSGSSRERAQEKFIELINSLGGYARFVERGGLL